MPRGTSPFGRQPVTYNPGKFRHAITLRASSAEHATTGDQQDSWDGSGRQLRGFWRQASQREVMIDGGRYSAASGVWEIPYLPNVSTSDRIEFGTRKYRIIGINNIDERNRELHLYCSEDEGAKGTTG